MKPSFTPEIEGETLGARASGRGQGRVTVQDVANAVGVSKTTAAAVLRNAPYFHFSEATRQRVLDAAQTLGYRPHSVAVALSSGFSNTLGLLLPLRASDNHLPILRSYPQDVFVSVFQAANQLGMRVTPLPLPLDPDAPLQIQDVMDRAVDGLVIASMRDADFIRQIYELGIPCVEIGSGHGPNLFHADNEGGAELAIAHLADLGHRRIAHWRIAHWRGAGDNYASIRRFEGFLSAMERRALPLPADVVAATREGVETLLRQPAGERPTAIFAYNDHQALLTLDIAHELGLRVPQDVSVVGFDDSILAEAARPQLTTIRNPIVQQADEAVQFLQTLWRGAAPLEKPLAVPTQLIVRHSTGPAPR